ncbi:hypothetical protein CYJ41_03465 [Campylobacter ureolyticus]|uniref:Lipoprotein n=1 Tax=Campylobacter ureolyticus TaxID=827 RepID=A0A2I1NAN5_9BACT|nr:hypothetical protein [Campylobacter ureolyticus]MCZ6105166.1 hypothetical protein [Campylobacter ureolyticus]MCZ6133111.1 hypothetical protein [Campylobacter ureolyticus]MCZ6157791.1 hypothetical protein [Campylobacter ureolyticus]MDK8323152.1 hypothetical protein [Campylobacter ureolyticus]PKZ29428.1 hypothetical protein CYJ41_03465 [Campylobacter ureolyticus]
MIKKIALTVLVLFLFNGCASNYDCDDDESAYTALLILNGIDDADNDFLDEFNRNFDLIANYDYELLKKDKEEKVSFCKLNINIDLTAKSLKEANKKVKAFGFLNSAPYIAQARAMKSDYGRQMEKEIMQDIELKNTLNKEDFKNYNNKANILSGTRSYNYITYDNGKGEILIKVKK